MIRDASGARDLTEWGPIATPLQGISRTRGILLHRAEGGVPEAGLWECTPGTWACHVTRDEFCHFLAGRCVYTDEAGGRTEIAGGDTAFFPAGWKGTCEVFATVRKVYMIG
ncbi:MAG TPA: cupin domain-containing protein [Candidatus Polarisedimenticolia bacterium]|nr:cupin domain-containing protein [Candidatus Polarisedimenticolia bacterium]